MQTITGKVLRLYVSTGIKEAPRKEVTQIKVAPEGILTDKFFGKDPQRAILITSTQSYALAQSNGISIPYGALGENILIDVDPYSLLPGDILRIGDASFEITQNCTLCKGLSNLHAKLPKLLKNDRGIFAKALQDASVNLHDAVTFTPRS